MLEIACVDCGIVALDLLDCSDILLVYCSLDRVCIAQNDVVVSATNARTITVRLSEFTQCTVHHTHISFHSLYLQALFPPSNTLINFNFFQILYSTWGERSARECHTQGQCAAKISPRDRDNDLRCTVSVSSMRHLFVCICRRYQRYVSVNGAEETTHQLFYRVHYHLYHQPPTNHFDCLEVCSRMCGGTR